MPLTRLRVSGLRCITQADLNLDSARNYIFGRNGAGKTSLLEAAYLLGRGRSFRTRQVRRLVQRGTDGFAVFGELSAPSGARRLGVSFAGGHLEKKIDGDHAGGMAMLAAALPVHAIDPGVHQLVDGGPSERRRFLDWGVFHVEHQYLELWKRYRRSLGQRNAALKAGANPRELAAWTEPLAAAGTAIDAQRRAYVQALAEAVGRFSWSLLEHAVTVEYAPGWSGDRPFADALSDSAARDRLAGSTDVGPHRADLVFRIDDRRVQDEASRGQQKLITAALVLAQATVQRASGEEPSVVLVDDPAAELDAASLERLLAVLENLPAQLIMTALTPEQLPPSANAAVFHVERGEVRAL